MERSYLLQYDIPEVRTRRGSAPVHGNPSEDLWRAGCVRITFSCWLVLESRIQRCYLVIDSMREAGCRVYTVPFDLSAAEQLRTMALENMRREIDALVERAVATRREADEKLDDESDNEFRKRRTAYMQAARGIDRRVLTLLRLMEEAAEGFGIQPSEIGIGGARRMVELIAGDMNERAAAFAQAHGILVRRGGEARAVARQIQAGSMPAAIAADWLRDNGEWDAGEALGRAFR